MPWFWLLFFAGAVVGTKAVIREHSVKLAGEWGPLILLFGGRVVPVPQVAPFSGDPPAGVLRAFRTYLYASGVRMAVAGLVAPNHPGVARRHGFTVFVPPVEWWPRFAALALCCQAISSRAPAGATVRNLYRPAAYNDDPAVAGEPRSYHVTSQAVDIDFVERRDREAAQAWIVRLYCKHPSIKLGLGVGRKTLHLDFLGQRSRPYQWPYDDSTGITAGRIPC